MATFRVTRELAQISRLILGDLDDDDLELDQNSSLPGDTVLELVRRAVYGSSYTNGPFLSNTILNGTFRQAELYCRYLIMYLVQSLRDTNCLHILSLADQVGKGCEALHATAFALSLRNFEAALESNADGWERLPEHLVMKILTSDHLVASSEVEVSKALINWASADLKSRQGSFLRLFTNCVRFREFSYEQLKQLMNYDHELQALDDAVPKLVYFAFIKLCVGEDLPAQWDGHILNLNPRRSQPTEERSQAQRRHSKNVQQPYSTKSKNSFTPSSNTLLSSMLLSPTRRRNLVVAQSPSGIHAIECRTRNSGAIRVLQW